VKRLLAWLAGIVGIAAVWRVVVRRGSKAPPAGDAPFTAEAPTVAAEGHEDGDDPAAELRRRLAAAREDGAEPEAGPERAPGTLDERRARVHAKAREAIETMTENRDEAPS
jgi:hypothetical protein